MTVEYKPGINPNRLQGSDWIRDRFQNVQKWDFTVPCSVSCPSLNDFQEDKMVVTVYNEHLNVIAPAEVLEIDQNYSLICIGPRVYPNNKVILTWLRGNEKIQHISTNEEGYPDDDVRLKNVLEVTARKSDDGQVYTCLAELDLGSNLTKQIAKRSETLQTYFFPQPPTILNKNAVEVNQEATLMCQVENVYPVDKMRVRWFLDGKEWNSVTKRPDPTTVWATIAWTPQEPGWTELTCMADFENYTSVMRNDSINIEMYVFPGPEIQVPTSIEGIPVNITCSVFNVSGAFQLRLKAGRDLLENASGVSELTIYHTVYPLAKLNGEEYTCEAELKLQLHSESINKEQSATLNVQYSPDEVQISQEQEWIEGKSQTLTCHGKGNPDPQVLWRRDGEIISSIETFHIPFVQLENGGHYMCTLYNEFGSINSSFRAEILYKPQNTGITVNNRTVDGGSVFIKNGDEVTMTCHSSGNPQATLEWIVPSQGKKVETNHSGVLHISHTTSEHKGVYRCRASNELGTDEKVVELMMEGETWWMVILFILAATAGILAVIWYLVNRARKTGEYKVLNATPNKNQEIPQGNENKEMFPLKKVNSNHFVIQNHSQTDSKIQVV
ncbi:intercellular adhesion molecule 5-like isoform X2 [Narcine bancroftii]